MMKFIQQILVFLTLCSVSVNSISAEKKVDDYIIHYNAFSSDFLSPEIANSYGITRSRDLALLNVTVQRENESGNRVTADASVKATAVNLTNKYKAMNLRRIVDGKAIYHIAEFKIINSETINFSIVILNNEKEITTIKFKQQFFK